MEGWRVVVVVGGGVICLPECLQFCFFSGSCLPLPFACLQISNQRLRNKVSRPDEGAVRRRRETWTRRGKETFNGIIAKKNCLRAKMHTLKLLNRKGKGAHFRSLRSLCRLPSERADRISFHRCGVLPVNQAPLRRTINRNTSTMTTPVLSDRLFWQVK